MDIRSYQIQEIQEIVNLFVLVWDQEMNKVSAKTYWAFSNLSSSKVLLMRGDKNQLLSVRGGIEWPLKIDNEYIKTYQLHGTCVHPDFRRRGIFSKINKKFVHEATNENYQLIFNVSVKNSRLGYEKLGWKYLKGFRRLTKVNKPIKLFKSEILKLNVNQSIKVLDNFKRISIPEEFFKARENHFVNLIHTAYTPEFFSWRLGNMEERYQSYSTRTCIIIYKIKIINKKKELIVGDVFMLVKKYSMFKDALTKLTKIENQDLTYTYIFNTHPYYNYFLRMFFLPNPINYNLNFGTKTLGEANENLLNNKKWGLSYLDIDTF